jgi:hypothetical protein
MAENIKVETLPTPIQRNKFDVAMELTELHSRLGGFRQGGFQAIQQTFAEYYSLARICEGATYEQLENLVSEEVKRKLLVSR